ncbi:MAG: hypothetical protein KDD33_00295 [Bdellovibrionales bacterium]|nr:hypothetical protein [Bdellovibrionales bacterium]
MIKLLSLLCLLYSFCAFAEEAPPAEYPYPSTSTQEDPLSEAPAQVHKNGTYIYNTKSKKPTAINIEGVEQPQRVSDDGIYYYGDGEKVTDKTPGDIEKPEDLDDDGTYYYSKESKIDPPSDVMEKPQKVTADGRYIYNAAVLPSDSVFSFRGGVYGPPDIQGPSKGFSQVYGDKASFILNVDYEWKLFDFLGNFLFKVGSGLFFSDGNGEFSGGSNPGIQPKETFQFLVFPNTATVTYKFGFSPGQLFVPYVDGGAGYYTFWERRSDGGSNHFGGAPVLVASAGLLISLSYFSYGTALYSEYGITETWLDLQFRQVVGLDERKDFTSNMITGGFAVGF